MDTFKIRVGVVVLDEQNRLLLARQNNRDFWVLPGGTLEQGETIGDCAIREILEEANLNVTLGPLLFVSDFMPSGRIQTLDVVFLGHLQGGTLQAETTQNINEIDFFTLNDVTTMAVQPETVMTHLMPMWQSEHWPSYSAYLGLS